MEQENATMGSSGIDPGGRAPICDPYLQLLNTYYVPAIIAVGLLGNVLSCTVFLTTHLKMRSSSYYLAALAGADFGYLTALLVYYCSYHDIFDLYHKQGWCQFFTYTSYVCASLSVWLIVAFTVERYIAVQYPLQRPQICTVSRAKTVVVSLFVVAMTSQLYLFWIAGVVSVDGNEICEMLPNYERFAKVVNIIDTFVTLIVPVVLIIVMNTMIARNLCLFRKRLQTGSLSETIDSERTVINDKQTQSGSSEKRSQNSSGKYNPVNSSKMNNSNQQECLLIHIKTTARSVMSSKNEHNITRMLLLISSVFIGLNLPSYVTRLAAYCVGSEENFFSCVQLFTMVLFYTNFSINFFLYAMCGITFRRCLCQVLRKIFKRHL